MGDSHPVRPHRPANRRMAGLLLLTMAFCLPAAAQEPPRACILRLTGMINEARARAVERYIERAAEEGVETFILELDTPGGDLQVSMDLGDFIFQREDMDVIAFVNPQAYSGGTMVALACKEIYVYGPTGRMGDVMPISATGQPAGEKSETATRETMLTYARKRGYPEALVKAMVTREIEVYRIEVVDDTAVWYKTDAELRSMSAAEQVAVEDQDVIVPAGELLSMDSGKAVEYGFARAAVRSRQHLFDLLGLKESEVRRLYLTPSERLLAILDTFSPLLIVVGFMLLYFEITHPGFGLPGILGIASFVAFFIIKWTLNYAHMLEIVLFLLGVVLLLVEILLIPGFGVAGVSGIALLVVSLVLTFQQFTIPRSPSEFHVFEFSLLKVLGSLTGALIGVAVMIRYLPSMPILGRIVHRTNLAAAHASEGLERRVPGLAGLVGEVGVALTALRPSGRAQFGKRRFDVVTLGDFIEKGASVQILEIHGNRIVVRSHEQL